MNILFVAHAFPDKNKPLTGGFPAYLYRVSSALIEMGHKPIILAGGQRNDSWVHKGIEIIRVRTGSFESRTESLSVAVSAYMKSYRLNQEIKKLEAKMKIDIIQFTSLWAPALLYYGKTPAVMRLSSYSKTYFSPVNCTVHTRDYVNMMTWLERHASKRCNAVFGPCRVIAGDFGKDIKRNVYVIETPFVEDVDAYDNAYIEKDLKGKKYALFFGVLSEHKGICVIGQCLREFLEKNEDYYFVFAGHDMVVNGENTVRMLRRCAGTYADRVIILSALLHDQLYPIIQNADFVVLPSLMDNLPNACIEAMHFGKVVIGTDGASFEQLIRHRVSGLLCRIGDPDDLLDKLQMAVALSEDEKGKIGERAKARIDRLKPEHVVNKLLQLYRCVIENSKEK